jgi:hypothetical protein
MKIIKKKRKFKPSKNSNITLNDCGEIILDNNEQVTFSHKDKKDCNYDVTKKNWGYYATPSINGRLKKNNFTSHIVVNKKTRLFFIMIVDINKKKSFAKYLKNQNLQIINWPKTLKK